MLKKHKKVVYKLTSRNIIPSIDKNNTGQVFITCRELNDVKKALVDSKMYGLFGIIDLKKLIVGKK